MRWYIVGYGDYKLKTVGGSPTKYKPVNRALDIYLDEWVQTQLFLYLGVTEAKYQLIKRNFFI